MEFKYSELETLWMSKNEDGTDNVDIYTKNLSISIPRASIAFNNGEITITAFSKDNNDVSTIRIKQ